MKITKSFCLPLIVGLIAGSQAAVAAVPEGSVDAGAQMERNRRDMERERVREQIAEDEAARKKKVEQQEKASDAEEKPGIRFELRQVNCNASDILTQEEIHAITDDYIGRQVTVRDLQEMAEKITALYRDKGYVTCGAVLPPQRIHEGVVEIRLIEGKTGEVTLKGNRYTKDSYILNRLGLKAGEIANFDKLNRDLRWFHGTNDLQLRVVMKPGAQEGTTDYEIMAFEPQNQTVSLYVDNDGYKTSGRWREGLFYNIRSLSNFRDALRGSFIRSKGTKAWSLGYSVPLSPTGMRLDLNYAANKTEVIKGELEPLGVDGKSTSYSLALRVPFHMTEHSRHEAGLQYVQQTTETNLGRGTSLVVPWVDDRIQRVMPYAAFTHYGNAAVVYHKHSFVWAHRKDIDGVVETGTIYRLSSFWQQRCKEGQFLQARLDGQLSSNGYLGSSDRFFIGGVNSVRGYEEGFIGGDRGMTLGLDYHIPLDKMKYCYMFPFFDWGNVGGKTAPAHRTLMSTGVGLEVRYKQWYSTLTVGFPLKKNFYGDHLGRARVDFSLLATF